jgi:hypothetical protein
MLFIYMLLGVALISGLIGYIVKGQEGAQWYALVGICIVVLLGVCYYIWQYVLVLVVFAIIKGIYSMATYR